MKNFKRPFKWCVFVLLGFLMLACGNKGPLYIPGEFASATQLDLGVK